MADRAARIIDQQDSLLVTDAVVVEAAYVLMSVYRVRREVVVDHLVDFVQRRNVSTFALEKALVIQALLLCRPSGRVSFGDAMLWAAARSAGGAVITFDDRFPAEGLEVRHDPAE